MNESPSRCWSCGECRELIVCTTESLGTINVCQFCEDEAQRPMTATEAFFAAYDAEHR